MHAIACVVNRRACCIADLKRLEASNVTSNPNTFLMQELHDAEDAAQRSHQKAADAHSALQRQSDELHDCKVQLSAVQTDLRVCSLQLCFKNML